MKRTLTLLVVVLTIGFASYAQTGQGGQPLNEKQFMTDQFNTYAAQLNPTQQQLDQAKVIMDKRFTEYDKAKVHVTDQKALNQLRKDYLALALKDMKPYLTNDQWAKVEAEADKRPNFSLD